MKKKKLLVIFTVVFAMVICVAGVSVFASSDTPKVTFDVSTKTFTFDHVNYTADEEGSYPDLFTDLKNMMPGDSRSMEIEISVIKAGNDTVKMYLKAENPNEAYRTLMDEEKGWAELTATIDDGKPTELSLPTKIKNALKDTTPDVYTGYVDDGGVYLGAFTGKEKSRIVDLTFALPITAGNEIADLTATVDWVFTAELIPEESNDGSSSGGGGTTGGGTIIGTVPPKLNTAEHYAYIVGRPGGYICPNENITRAEVAAIFTRLLTEDARNTYWSTYNHYSDVPSNAWYHNVVSTLSRAGIITGYPDGTFRGDDPITRAEFAVIVGRFFTVDAVAGGNFSDISGHWAETNIDAVAELGLVNGYADGTFRPNTNITRAEAITLINRALNRKPDADHFVAGMNIWVDNMDRSKWYYAQIQEATNSHDYYFTDTIEVWTGLVVGKDLIHYTIPQSKTEIIEQYSSGK